jgi:hypothetical protein
LVGCDVPLLAMLLLYQFSTGRKPLEVKLRRQPNQPWTAFRILFVARPITRNEMGNPSWRLKTTISLPVKIFTISESFGL